MPSCFISALRSKEQSDTHSFDETRVAIRSSSRPLAGENRGEGTGMTSFIIRGDAAVYPHLKKGVGEICSLWHIIQLLQIPLVPRVRKNQVQHFETIISEHFVGWLVGVQVCFLGIFRGARK